MARLKHTSWRAWQTLCPIILGCMVIWASTQGCTSRAASTDPLGVTGTRTARTLEQPGKNRATKSDGSMPSLPAQSTDDLVTTDSAGKSDERPAEPAGASEQGRKSEPRPPIEMVDPGAALFVEAIVSRLPQNHDELRTITLAPMRNFSRASEDEFNEMRRRLASVLTDAGRSLDVRFVHNADVLADYEMSGSAYLVVRSGFDFWELFPTVTKDRLSPPAWTSPVPVLFLRTDRPNQPQVFFEALGGNAP